MRPRVSVVIPVHNGMPFLGATLDSVRNQTRAAAEIIVVENGSTDGTLEFLHTQRDITVKVQPQLVSAASNWSTAVSLATGDFVKLLCADDYLTPSCLERQSDLLLEWPNCVMTAGRRRIIDSQARVLTDAVGLAGLRGVVSGETALRRGLTLGTNLFGEPSAVMFRADAVQSQLPWPEDAGYTTDLAMYIKVLKTGSVFLDEIVVAEFRVSRKSWSIQAQSSQASDVMRTFRIAVEHRDISAGRMRIAISSVMAYGRSLLRRIFYLRIR